MVIIDAKAGMRSNLQRPQGESPYINRDVPVVGDVIDPQRVRRTDGGVITGVVLGGLYVLSALAHQRIRAAKIREKAQQQEEQERNGSSKS